MKHIKLITVLLLQAALVISCTKESLEPEADPEQVPDPVVEQPVPPPPVVTNRIVTYKIYEGSHFAYNVPMQTITADSLVFSARFDSSCVYTTLNPKNQDDINKLYGFSDYTEFHQTHSARVGWRWKNNQIELFAYCYSGGIRSFSLLGTVNLNEWADLSIRLSPAGYEFQYQGVSTFMKRTVREPRISGYMLFPYFGGNETAPHTVKIDIKRR